MSPRRPELPYTGTANTLAARTSPCPPVPLPLTLFSRVAVRLVEAEIQRAMRRTMPPSEPTLTPVHVMSFAMWAGLTLIAAAGTAVLVGMRVMRGAA